jgi:hypothetical protein
VRIRAHRKTLPAPLSVGGFVFWPWPMDPLGDRGQGLYRVCDKPDIKTPIDPATLAKRPPRVDAPGAPESAASKT